MFRKRWQPASTIQSIRCVLGKWSYLESRELTAKGAGLTKVSVSTENALLSHNGNDFPAVRQRTVKDDYVIYYSTDPAPTVAAILHYLNEKQDRLIDLRVERPSLEERFLEITAGGVQ